MKYMTCNISTLYMSLHLVFIAALTGQDVSCYYE